MWGASLVRRLKSLCDSRHIDHSACIEKSDLVQALKAADEASVSQARSPYPSTQPEREAAETVVPEPEPEPEPEAEPEAPKPVVNGHDSTTTATAAADVITLPDLPISDQTAQNASECVARESSGAFPYNR